LVCAARACDRCADYLRLYLDVDVADELTPATPWSYELCGNISALPMKQFYSSRQTLAMRFHSDAVRRNQTGFRGIYRFVDRGRSIDRSFRVLTSHSTRKIDHFGDVLRSQSLGAVLMKLDLTQQRQTTQEHNSLS